MRGPEERWEDQKVWDAEKLLEETAWDNDEGYDNSCDQEYEKDR